MCMAIILSATMVVDARIQRRPRTHATAIQFDADAVVTFDQAAFCKIDPSLVDICSDLAKPQLKLGIDKIELQCVPAQPDFVGDGDDDDKEVAWANAGCETLWFGISYCAGYDKNHYEDEDWNTEGCKLPVKPWFKAPSGWEALKFDPAAVCKQKPSNSLVDTCTGHAADKLKDLNTCGHPGDPRYWGYSTRERCQGEGDEDENSNSDHICRQTAATRPPFTSTGSPDSDAWADDDCDSLWMGIWFCSAFDVRFPNVFKKQSSGLCRLPTQKSGALKAGDEEAAKASVVDVATAAAATNNQPTSDAEVVRTVFEGIVAIAFLYVAFVVGAKSRPESGIIANPVDGNIEISEI